MKKIFVLGIIFLLIFSVTSCKKKTSIISLEEIKSQYYSDDQIEKYIRHVRRDVLVKEWGTPDKRIEYENEDVWVLNERKFLVVSYNRNNKVEDVDIED